MFKLIYFLIQTRKFSTGNFFIRNKELPICSECLHFIEHTNNYPYDPIPSNAQYGRCKKFGEKNLITGAFEYEIAMNCRLNAKECGKFGSEFTEKIKS
jgi:hypothetical protein